MRVATATVSACAREGLSGTPLAATGTRWRTRGGRRGKRTILVPVEAAPVHRIVYDAVDKYR